MPEKPKIATRAYFIHAFFLVMTIFWTWFWVNNPVLLNLNLFLILGMIFLYIVAKLILGRREPYANLVLNTLIFTVALLVIIASTGGLSSSFFFLIYFLLFAVALLFNPFITLTLTLTLVFFFANTLGSLDAAIKLISMLFFTILALFFAKGYLKLLEIQKKVKILAKEGKKLSGTVESEETNTLLWLSLNFKEGLLKIIYRSSDLLSDIGRLSLTQKEKLGEIHETAKDVLKSGQKLQEKIDRETD